MVVAEILVGTIAPSGDTKMSSDYQQWSSLLHLNVKTEIVQHIWKGGISVAERLFCPKIGDSLKATSYTNLECLQYATYQSIKQIF